jgi:hypothetical protein
MMGTDLTKYPGVNSFFDLLTGELQQFNRLAGGSIVQYTVVTADTAVSAGPAIFYGISVLTAGTSVTVYDNASAASGTKLVDALSSAIVGTTKFPAGEGVGILMENGIYVDITGGTYIVFYVAAA